MAVVQEREIKQETCELQLAERGIAHVARNCSSGTKKSKNPPKWIGMPGCPQSTNTAEMITRYS